MNTFLPTIAIMTAVQTWMKAAVLTPASAPNPAVNLVEDCQFYSSPDLVRAFQELKSFKNRICLIIPSYDHYQETREGNSLKIHCVRQFTLLLCDRDVGNRQKASTGDPADPAHPGVLAMKDYVENNLIALNFDFLPALLVLHPLEGQPFKLVDKDRTDLAGRLGWLMTWQADAGDRVFTIR
ncbi:MAG TPA: hypothetical protein VHB20_14670 [Verrucomicrobiae bacterium]|jgi:hypothetical protein|nr:hypothetical protein [Verrucomicrobiae bacterium]